MLPCPAFDRQKTIVSTSAPSFCRLVQVCCILDDIGLERDTIVAEKIWHSFAEKHSTFFGTVYVQHGVHHL